MTCPTRDGAAAFIKEGECVWARLSGREFNQDKTTQTLGFDETSFEVAGGLQGQARVEVWRIGGALGYEHGSSSIPATTPRARSTGCNGGAVLKYNPGPLLLAGRASRAALGWLRHRAAR